MPFWDRKDENPEDLAGVTVEAHEATMKMGAIPVAERPSVEDSSGDEFSFGEAEPGDYSRPSEPTSSGRETYVDDEGVRRYADTNRKVRSDSGTGSRRSPSKTRGRKPQARLHEKAGAGATILYGGAGAILTGTGIAPAAGFSMQGLADEAGPEIAEWAHKRSPRFYKFLESLSDTAGIGKYVAAPASAEAYLRMENARPALGPVVTSLHGPDIEAPLQAMVEQYDSWKASAHADANGGMEAPEL